MQAPSFLALGFHFVAVQEEPQMVLVGHADSSSWSLGICFGRYPGASWEHPLLSDGCGTIEMALVRS